MSLNLVGRPPETLLFVVLTALPLLDIPGFALNFAEATGKFVAFVEKLSRLCEQDHVGEVQPAELVVIAKVSVLLHIMSLFQKHPIDCYTDKHIMLPLPKKPHSLSPPPAKADARDSPAAFAALGPPQDPSLPSLLPTGSMICLAQR